MFANLETARYATVNVNNFAEKCLNELLGASNQLVGALFQYCRSMSKFRNSSSYI